LHRRGRPSEIDDVAVITILARLGVVATAIVEPVADTDACTDISATFAPPRNCCVAELDE
jgi:hypothetical protein